MSPRGCRDSWGMEPPLILGEPGAFVAGAGPRGWGLGGQALEPVERISYNASHWPQCLHPLTSRSCLVSLLSCTGGFPSPLFAFPLLPALTLSSALHSLSDLGSSHRGLASQTRPQVAPLGSPHFSSCSGRSLPHPFHPPRPRAHWPQAS